MTIRTHKMIADSGEIDYGSMSLISSIAKSTKMFFPCNEGTGTSVSDAAATRSLSSGVSYSTANTMRIQYSAAPTGDVIPSISSSQSFLAFMAWKVTGVGSMGRLLLGADTASTRILLTQDNVSVEDDGNNEVVVNTNLSGISIGDDLLVAIHLDRDTNELNVFAVTATASKEDLANDTSAIGAISPSNVIGVSGGVPQDYYGLGLYVLDAPLSLAVQRRAVSDLWASLLGPGKALPASLVTTKDA